MGEEKEKPLTRKDVLRLIQENDGTAEGLDLSGREFKEGINLRKFNLRGIILRKSVLWGAHLERAKLEDAHLEEAQLARAHLEEADLTKAHLEGAELWNAHLERADLWGTYLQGAYLGRAHLQGAILRLAKFSPHTDLTEVDWGNYIIGEENVKILGKKKPGAFDIAADTYQRLKMLHINAGKYDIAGKFFYREMEAKRKALKWWPNPLPLIRQTLYWLLCGYGEKPLRVVSWGISVLFVSALIYFFLRGIAPHTLTVQTFLNSLYYSAVSFTALGYGPWFSATSVRGWAQGVGAAEAIIGVFTIALFLVTFTRKMIR